MRTNKRFKNFAWAVMILATIPGSGFAQSEADKTNERLEKIEQQLSQQQATINNLRSEIESVTKQNLALKKNLNLQPTVAKFVDDNKMDVRVIEVNGDSTTGNVDVLLSITNIGPKDKSWSISKLIIVDENGATYNDLDRYDISIGDGEFKNLYSTGKIDMHPNVPHNVRIKIHKVNPESQYLKFLQTDFKHILEEINAQFENLPIKWQSQD